MIAEDEYQPLPDFLTNEPWFWEGSQFRAGVRLGALFYRGHHQMGFVYYMN